VSIYFSTLANSLGLFLILGIPPFKKLALSKTDEDDIGAAVEDEGCDEEDGLVVSTGRESGTMRGCSPDGHLSTTPSASNQDREALD
jgi:hypothetical protein